MAKHDAVSSTYIVRAPITIILEIPTTFFKVKFVLKLVLIKMQYIFQLKWINDKIILYN